MATGAKMSYNFYQNGKYGTLPQNPPKDMEVSQDMHLKMSKKIAQLTKVIYALNTKNDEHEAVVAALREQHEEAIQQVLAETKAKVAHFKQQLGDQLQYQTRINALEQNIRDYQQQKQDAFTEFTTYKLSAEERETQLRTEHSQKILSLSQEVLTAKQDFEEKLKLFDSLKLQYERDKLEALERLEEEHKKRLVDLEKDQLSQQSDLSTAKDQLEQKHREELDSLSKKCELLKEEKKKLSEEFEEKLSKAQAFFDKELAVLRDSQNKEASEQLEVLRGEYDKCRKDFAFQEGQLKKRVEDLLSELSLREDEVANYKSQLDDLQNVVQNQDSSSALISQQLSAAQKESNELMTKLREAQAELAASRERCDQQARDLVSKSTEIGSLEVTKEQQQKTIQDLESQLAQLKDKVHWLESAKHNLESKTQQQEHSSLDQIRQLEKSLEEMSIEKQTLKERLERELVALQETIKKKEEELTSNHTKHLEELSKQHQEELHAALTAAAADHEKVKGELQEKLQSETNRLQREIDSIQAEYEQVRGDLTGKLHTAEEEVKRLDALVQEGQQGLGTASSQVKSLQDAHERLKTELESTRTDLRTSKSKAASLQAEYDKLKLLHENKVKEAQVELKTKLDQLSADLDKKWMDTLRLECDKLRAELTSQKDEDKRSALAQLTSMKDKELADARADWNRTSQELLDQIAALKKQLEAMATNTSSEIDEMRKAADAENKRLRQEMQEAAEEYASKIEIMEKSYKEQLNHLELEKDKEIKLSVDKLQARHIEDLQAQVTAHKTLTESLKEDLESRRLAELDSTRIKHKHAIEVLQAELEQKHSQDLEELSRTQQMQLQAARMELERAIDLSKQKDGEYAMKVSEMEETINHRKHAIKSLEEEIKRLQRGVKDMSHELEAKGKEILKIRSEANQAARAREEQLLQERQAALEELETDFIREKDNMLVEFSEAQDLLKDKISALQIMLEEAEDRYRDRESRPEDLASIRRLQEDIQEKEQIMQKLIDDKKHFQMELINRETNFNKVFNANPNVGLLNPLAKKPKSGERGALKFSSSPSLGPPGSSSRLNPLPNSPVHDERFNHMRPLPPTSKKFVR